MRLQLGLGLIADCAGCIGSQFSSAWDPVRSPVVPTWPVVAAAAAAVILVAGHSCPGPSELMPEVLVVARPGTVEDQVAVPLNVAAHWRPCSCCTGHCAQNRRLV